MSLRKWMVASVVVTALAIGAPLPGSAQEARQVRVADVVQQFLATGRFQEAEQLLEQTRGAGDASAEILYLSGLTASARGDMDAALVFLRAATEAGPDFPRIRLEYARTLFVAGQDDEAETQFRTVLRQGVPREVRRTVEGHLAEIANRRSWVVHVSASTASDSNPAGATSAETVDIFGLPFLLEPDARARSGTGIQLRTAGEVRHRLEDGKTLFAGLSLDETQYAGGDWDDRSIRPSIGIRDAATRTQIAATGGLRWYGGKIYERTLGLRIQKDFLLSDRLYLTLSAEPYRRIVETYGDTRSWVLPATGALGWAVTEDVALGMKGLVKREIDETETMTHWDVAAGPFLRTRVLGVIGEADLLLGHRWFSTGQGFTLDPREDRWLATSFTLAHEDIEVLGIMPFVGVSYDQVDSRIGLYSYDRARLLFGARSAF